MLTFDLPSTSTLNPVVRHKSHTPCISDFLKKNRTESYCNDVVMNFADGKQLTSSLILLAYSSSYIRDIIKSKGKIEEIDLTQLNADKMKQILDYMYSHEIKITVENVEEILYFAEFLHMNELKNFCIEYLEQTISPLNCFVLESLAEKYHSDKLKTCVTTFMCEHFGEVVAQCDFTIVSLLHLKLFIETYLRSASVSEKLIYKCVVRWVKSDEENRKEYFLELMGNVKFELLSSNFLRNDVTREPLVIENHQCSRLLLDALTKKLQMNNGRRSSLLILGGSFKNGSAMVKYDIELKTWENYQTIPQGRRSACGVVLANCVYFIGGIHEQNNATHRVDCFDIDEEKWLAVQPMNHARFCAAACTHRGEIYVVGGSNGNLKSSAEVFSPSLNKWRSITALKSARTGHSLVDFKGHVYCIGGHDGNDYLSSVERYVSAEEGWVEVADLQTPRRWLAAVSTDHFIYAFGGRADQELRSLRSVERYDPDTNSWSYCSEMLNGRDSFNACVLDERIYVVGGNGRSDEVGQVVEVYDPDRNSWGVVCKDRKSVV